MGLDNAEATTAVAADSAVAPTQATGDSATAPLAQGAPPPSPDGQPSIDSDGSNAPTSVAESAFAALARRERALLAQQKSIKAEREKMLAEVSKERESFTSESAKIRRAMEMIAAGKGLEAFESVGLRYEDLTKAALGRPAKDANEKAQEEIRSLRAEVEQIRTERAQAAHERVRYQIRSNIVAHIENASDKYPVIAGTPGAHDQILAVIEQHAQDTAAVGEPELLDLDSAAQIVEAQLREGLQPLAPLISRLFGQSVPGGSGDTPNSDPTRSNRSANEHGSNGASNNARTLSQSLASQTTTKPPAIGKKTLRDIERERIDAAIRAAER